MDAIDANNWKLADKMLEGKWWQGYDDKIGCPRLEFVGHLFRDPIGIPEGFSRNSSYADLVNWMANRPQNDKVIRQTNYSK